MAKQARKRLPGQPRGPIGWLLPWAVGLFLPPLIRLWGRTCMQVRVNEHIIDEGVEKGGILVAWHGNLTQSLYMWRDRGTVGMVSPVWIGEIIARTMRGLGFDFFRSSSGYSPTAGLKRSLRVLREGKLLAQVPDGPEGPPRVVKPGVIYLASMSGKPIIPSYVGSNPKWQARSWDRHEIPRFFATVEARVSEPFYVPPDLSREQVEHYCRELERRMHRLECETVLSLWRLNYREMRERKAGRGGKTIRRGRWKPGTVREHFTDEEQPPDLGNQMADHRDE